MGPDLTPEEATEALRTMGALARARLNGDDEDVSFLLGDANLRQLCAVLNVYINSYNDVLVRLHVAVRLMEDGGHRALVLNLDSDATAADPEVHEEIERTIAASQTRASGGG